MARKPREKASTRVYHVMIRGINKQDIFFDRDDFVQMQWAIHDAQVKKYADGSMTYEECQIYAYCIMNNHVHILLRERNLDISQIMKKIQDRYAIRYNYKYNRVGHLFQDRFRSEPVNDINYFKTLLRYIHRNPVVGMECEQPEEYPYSSWREYLQNAQDTVRVILPDAYNVVDSYFTRPELIEWVNQDVRDDCMDMDSERFTLSEEEAWEVLSDISGEAHPEDFRCNPPDYQLECIAQAIRRGINVKQASRLSSVTQYRIKKYLDQIHNTSAAPLQQSSISYQDILAHLPELNTEKCYAILNSITSETEKSKRKLLQLLTLFHNHTFIDSTIVSELLGISDSMSRRLLRLSVTHELLKKEGNTRGTRYSIPESLHQSNET